MEPDKIAVTFYLPDEEDATKAKIDKITIQKANEIEPSNSVSSDDDDYDWGYSSESEAEIQYDYKDKYIIYNQGKVGDVYDLMKKEAWWVEGDKDAEKEEDREDNEVVELIKMLI